MKRLAEIFLLITSIQANSAQDFNGIYRGDLFSKDNVISLRVKKGAVSGILYTSVNDKFSFQPLITGRELSGTLDRSSIIWTMKGTLFGDSLSMMMSSGQATKQAVLLRISSDPMKNISDIIESFSRDGRLIGNWLLVKSEDLNGSPKKIDSRIAGMIRTFSPDGTSYAMFPSMESQLRSLPPGSYSPPLSKWSTQDSNLTTTTTVANFTKTGSVPYEVRNDTLIIISKSEKSFYLRRK